MKTCFKCKVSKPESEFYRHPQMADGYLGKCKECAKRDTIENRNKHSLYYREYDRSRADLPKRVEARKSYEKTSEGREARKKANEVWKSRNPRKRAAEVLFRNRQRNDPSLSKKPCEVCGAEKVHGHHENYDEPLKVRWLCPKHHSERHKEMRKLGIKP